MFEDSACKELVNLVYTAWAARRMQGSTFGHMLLPQQAKDVALARRVQQLRREAGSRLLRLDRLLHARHGRECRRREVPISLSQALPARSAYNVLIQHAILQVKQYDSACKCMPLCNPSQRFLR